MKLSKLSLLLAFLCCGALATAETRPNVVVMIVDDLGYADVSCLANGAVKTPNIDRLAATGVTFTSGYVTAPLPLDFLCCEQPGAAGLKPRI